MAVNLPGKAGSISFDSKSDEVPLSAVITAVPVGSKVTVGSPLNQQATQGTITTFSTSATLDLSGLYPLTLNYRGRTATGAIEVATKLSRRIGSGSNSAWLSIWSFGGVVAVVSDSGGTSPYLWGFQNNGSIFAASTAVQAALASFVGASPGGMEACIAALEVAWLGAQQSADPTGKTVAPAVSMLVGAGWNVTP